MAETEASVIKGASTPAARGGLRRKFYVVLAVLMLLLIFIGFWPSYYGPLMEGRAEAPLLLHVHGVIYIGWMALLIVQVTLAARGQIRTHRALGQVGIGYGALVWVVGLIVSFAAPAFNVNSGEWTVDQAAAFIPIPLGDMVLFGSFFLAAVLNRNKPELHKRLMLLATMAILFAAAFRLQNAGVSIPVAIVVWYVPLAIAMVYDLVQRGRVHMLYVVGAIVMGLALLRLPFGNTEAWLSIGRPIVESLT
jgi:hypothetical protein